MRLKEGLKVFGSEDVGVRGFRSSVVDGLGGLGPRAAGLRGLRVQGRRRSGLRVESFGGFGPLGFLGLGFLPV